MWKNPDVLIGYARYFVFLAPNTYHQRCNLSMDACGFHHTELLWMQIKLGVCDEKIALKFWALTGGFTICLHCWQNKGIYRMKKKYSAGYPFFGLNLQLLPCPHARSLAQSQANCMALWQRRSLAATNIWYACLHMYIYISINWTSYCWEKTVSGQLHAYIYKIILYIYISLVYILYIYICWAGTGIEKENMTFGIIWHHQGYPI